MNKINIREIAYKIYKQDWIDTHTTKKSRLDVLREYYMEKIECLTNGVNIDTFEGWLWENGYLGDIYSCYEEFLDNEYQDEEYMVDLLCYAPLVCMYIEDLRHNIKPTESMV